MIEYMHARVQVNNYNVHCRKFNWEGGDHVSLWNGAYNADKYSLFELNVQNKPTSIECNSSTGCLNLIATNFGRHERYCYWVKPSAPGQRWCKNISNDEVLIQSDPTSCPQTKREITKYIHWQQFLRRGITSHKSMLNTCDYWLKSNTDTTSLTCPGTAMVGTFNDA